MNHNLRTWDLLSSLSGTTSEDNSLDDTPLLADESWKIRGMKRLNWLKILVYLQFTIANRRQKKKKNDPLLISSF